MGCCTFRSSGDGWGSPTHNCTTSPASAQPRTPLNPRHVGVRNPIPRFAGANPWRAGREREGTRRRAVPTRGAGPSLPILRRSWGLSWPVLTHSSTIWAPLPILCPLWAGCVLFPYSWFQALQGAEVGCPPLPACPEPILGPSSKAAYSAHHKWSAKGVCPRGGWRQQRYLEIPGGYWWWCLLASLLPSY